MTRNHKAVSLAMALFFCLSFLAPLLVAPAVAEAATADVTPDPVQVTVASNQNCSSIRVLDTTGTMVSGTQVVITLLNGATFGSDVDANFVTFPLGAYSGNNNLTGATGTATMGSNYAVINITGGTTGQAYSQLQINFGKLGGKSINVNQTGDVVAQVEVIGFLTATDKIIGIAGSGVTTSVGLSHPSVSEGTNKPLGGIKITENRANVMKNGDKFTVSMPSDIKWTSAPTNITTTDPNFTVAATGTSPFYNGSGQHTCEFVVTRTGTPTAPHSVFINGILANVETEFANGDIIVDIEQSGYGSPAGTISIGTAWIGVKGDYTIIVEQGDETVPTLYAGQYGKKPGSILIKESIAGTLVSGRSITVELPANAYWTKIPTIKTVKGSTGVISCSTTLAGSSADRRKLTFNVDNASTSATEILLVNGEIAVLGDSNPGELLATIAGTAGASGTVLIANIAEPVTVNVDPINDVIIGLKNQQTGTVTITEAEVGLIRAKSGLTSSEPGVLQVVLPSNCSWTVTPTVEVTSGDLKIDTNNISKSGSTLYIPIKSSSKTTPSVITISGIELTLDRTIPEGTLVTGLNGAAINNEYYCYTLTTTDGKGLGQTRNTMPSVTTFTIANCVTPAPTESVTQTYGTFTLGSSIYYVNGMAKLMDVAVFAQDGRIFVPQRFLGLALGIPDENIVWDQATQTATFTTLDGKVIVFTVGSNIFTVDGVEFTMDVTPQVVDGRICLPVRFMVEALGGTVGWDQATQTAFFSLG